MKRIHNNVIDSTQNLAKQTLPLLSPEEWYVFTADEQTAGQGTRSRTWASPPRVNIYATYTILLDKEEGDWLIHIPQLVALSVSQVLETFNFSPTIKWPNDVLLDGKKMCGILSQTVRHTESNQAKLQLVIGIGVNVNMSQDYCDKLDQPVTSMAISAEKAFDKELILERLNKQLNENVSAFIQSGNFSEYSKLINKRLERFDGQLLTFDSHDDGTVDGILNGYIKGLTEEGLLRIEIDGEERTFISGRFLRGQECDKLLAKKTQKHGEIPRSVALDSKNGVAMIYRTQLKPGVENEQTFYSAWKIISQYFTESCGAIQSRIHCDRTSPDMRVIYSLWSSMEACRNYWLEPKQRLPEAIETARLQMEEATEESVSKWEVNLHDIIGRGEDIYSGVFRREILIYSDEGVSLNSVEELMRSLNQLVDLEKYFVRVVGANYIKHVINWEEHVDLLIIPGGRSLPYYKSLGDVGNNRIVNYVRSGGACLGICAGAYYGAKNTVFERGKDIEVVVPGGLNFFSGTAEGPAYGLGQFCYENEKGARIAQIKFCGTKVPQQQVFHVYYNGGCYFHTSETVSFGNEEVIGRYEDIEGFPAAIVKCQFGKGVAVLSGVHIEYSSNAQQLQKDENIVIRNALQHHESNRLNLFSLILTKLGISIRRKIMKKTSATEESMRKPSFFADSDQPRPFEFNVIKTEEGQLEYEKYRKIPTTQTIVKDRLSKVQDGRFYRVSAKEQNDGRGTGGKVWHSPQGNVYVTFGIPLSKTQQNLSVHFTQVATVSVAEVLTKYGFDPKLKWLNDIWLRSEVNRKKVSGVLVEGPFETGESDTVGMVVGIGINVLMDVETCANIRGNIATSLQIESMGRVFTQADVDQIIEDLSITLMSNIKILYSEGFEKGFQKRIDDNLEFLGEKVVVESSGDSTSTITGIVLGVTAEGNLRLRRDPEGDEVCVSVGEKIKLDDAATKLRSITGEPEDKPRASLRKL